MKVDLERQLSEYGRQIDSRITPLGLNDVQEPARSPMRVRRGPVVAMAAAAVVMIVGLVAVLASTNRGDLRDAPVATQPPPTATEVPPTAQSTPTTLAQSTPTTLAEGVAPTTQVVVTPDPALTPPTIIAEVVTPSSIGDATWTVYEGESEAAFDAILEVEMVFGGPLDPSLPESLMSAEGVATRTNPNPIGNVGDTSLTQWSVGVDWIGTAILHDETLADRSDNGRLLGLSIESGTVEIYLFTGETERDDYYRGRGAEPEEAIARYEWTSAESDEGWSLDIVEAVSGEPVGSITSAFSIEESDLFVLSDGDSIGLVTPEWFDPDYEWFSLDVADGFLVYVKQGDSNSPASYHIWRSNDGENWSDLGLPSGFPSGYFPMGVAGDDGFYMVTLDDITEENEPGPDFLTLRSENGVDWVRADGLPNTFGFVHRVTAGWVWASPAGDSPSFAIWTSSDGVSWERINTSQVPGPFLEGGFGWGANDNTLVGLSDRHDSPIARLWVVQFP